MVIADDTTYCDEAGDVYYYIRNHKESDPGSNIDTVFCVGQYAGAGYKETEVVNTVNFTGLPLIHQASLYGTTGLITSKFGIQEGTKQALPVMNDETVIIPVDYRKSGSLDLLGLSASGIRYYDDNYINSQYEFIGYTNPVNPVCQNYVYTLKRTVQDDEKDGGSCYSEEFYVNGTSMGVFDNVSISETMIESGSANLEFNYYADVTGNYVLKTYCKDQYHTSYITNQFNILVSNASDCNDPDVIPIPVVIILDNETIENADFDAATESLWCGLGLCSKKARNAAALFMVMVIVVGLYMYTRNVVVSLAALPVSLLLFFFIGLATIFPVVVMIIISITALVYFVMSGRTAGA